LVLEKFSQQFQRSGLVAALLDEDIENLTFLVDGPPHEHPFAVDPDNHLVEMPDAVGASASPADVGGDGWAELAGPAAHGFVADIDPALGQNLLNVAQAGRKAEVEPDRQPDRLVREPVALVGNGLHRLSHGGDELALD